MITKKLLKSLRNKQSHLKKRIIAKSSECQKFVGVKASLKFKFGWKKPEKTTFEPETQGTGSFPRYLLTEINLLAEIRGCEPTVSGKRYNILLTIYKKLSSTFLTDLTVIPSNHAMRDRAIGDTMAILELLSQGA